MSRPSIAAAALLVCLACNDENPVQPPPQPPPVPPPPPHTNHRPVAHIRGYPSSYEGAGTFFAADSSADPDGDSLRVTWLSGDGRRSEGCIDASGPGYGGFDSDCIVFWSYPDDGTYLASVIVADDSGAADTASMEMTILNALPSLHWFHVPPHQTVGSPVSIAFIIDDLGTADTHTIAVEWGDGTSETVAAVDTGLGYCNFCSSPVSAPEILSHTYATVGTYSIAVTIQDDDGGASTSVTPSPVVVFNPHARQSVAGYEAVDLGTLGGNSVRPADINNHRQVVGTGLTASEAEHAFLWDETGMLDLGAMGHEGSEAIRINETGIIAGTVWTHFTGVLDDNVVSRNIGTIWQNGVGTTLDSTQACFTAGIREPSGYRSLFQHSPRIVRAINGSGEIAWASYGKWNTDGRLWGNGSWHQLPSYPIAMNDRGQVVGARALDDGSPFRAFVWENGSSRDLPPLAPQPCERYDDCSVAVAMDINESGQVVGISTDAARQFHFVLWEDDKIKDLGLADFAHPQYAPRIVMNDRGEIAGSVAGKAFFWNAGTMISLPFAGGLAEVVGLNENGDVVGTILSGAEQHAFVWSQARGMVDLGTGPHGFSAAWVVDINDRGDILGYTGSCQIESIGSDALAQQPGNRCVNHARNPDGLRWMQVRGILWRNTR